MDEILIEEKRYISSKRAAKMTGYAKDYIGQLCREGRVPARLVGRSWYVLESAIEDHRFGDQNTSPTSRSKESADDTSMLSLTSQFPRYEASNEEVIPFINHLRNTEAEVAQHLQDSWRAWFDHVGKPNISEKIVDTETVAPAARTEYPADSGENPETKKDNGKDVNVPIHAIYTSPPRELLPKRHFEAKPQEAYLREDGRGTSGMVVVAFRTAGVVLTVLAVIMAALGTGYFDANIISNKQVSMISGVIFYNK